MKFSEIPTVQRFIDETYDRERDENADPVQVTPLDMPTVALLIGFALAMESELENLRAQLKVEIVT